MLCDVVMCLCLRFPGLSYELGLMLAAWSDGCGEFTSWDAMGSQWILDVDTSREIVGSPWDDDVVYSP